MSHYCRKLCALSQSIHIKVLLITPSGVTPWPVFLAKYSVSWGPVLHMKLLIRQEYFHLTSHSTFILNLPKSEHIVFPVKVIFTSYIPTFTIGTTTWKVTSVRWCVSAACSSLSLKLTQFITFSWHTSSGQSICQSPRCDDVRCILHSC